MNNNMPSVGTKTRIFFMKDLNEVENFHHVGTKTRTVSSTVITLTKNRINLYNVSIFRFINHIY